MKKRFILILILFTTINVSFSEETNKKENPKSYNRFGMNVLSLSAGIGFNLSAFPLSFYVANNLNQLISFGFDFGLNYNLHSTFGFHMGFGKLYKNKSSNPNLNVGYLIEFSAGFAPYSTLIPFTYIGFSPNFVFEVDQFFFRTGLYIDTAFIINVSTGFGFLLK